MSACPDHTRLSRYRAGGCNEAEAAAIRSHLAICAMCRARVADASAGEFFHPQQLPGEPVKPGDPAEPVSASPDADTRADSGDAATDQNTGHTDTLSLGLSPSEQFALIQPEIPGYKFVRALGRGGQAFVFEAVQTSTKRKVAIKILLEGPYASAASLKRFKREVELVAQLRHPNIITIHDSGVTADGRPYFVMDYVRGEALHVHVRTNHLSREAILRIFAAVCDGMDYARENGVIHRDLKPTNIMVDSQGSPRILDFGLARWRAEPSEDVLSSSQALVGTLPYFSPEQTRGNRELVDHRSDVYALGVILYELFTGKRPYPTDGSMNETIRHIVDTLPMKPTTAWQNGLGAEARERSRDRSNDRSASREASRTDQTTCPIDRDLELILLKTLAKEPQRRYQTAGELKAEVERYLRGDPIQARPDSVIYKARKYTRSFVLRNPLAAKGLVILIAAMAGGQLIGGCLAYDWTPAQRYYYQALTAMLKLNDVRIIAIQSDDEMRALAAAEGIDVNEAKYLRRLHGRLFERLATAGPRVVVSDITFEEAFPADGELLRGIQALAARGVPVVVPVKTWGVSADKPAKLSPTLAPHVRTGCVYGHFQAGEPWSLEMLQRGPLEPVPTLAVSAWAALREPVGWPQYSFHSATESLRVAYYQRAPEAPGGRLPLNRSDQVRLTAIRQAVSDEAAYEIVAGDLLGHLMPLFPSLREFKSATIDYVTLFKATEAERRALIGDRVVLLADLRESSNDFHDHTLGPKLPGCYGHAASIQALISGAILRVPRWWQQYAWVACGVLPGLIVGRFLARRLGLRIVACFGIAVLLVGAGLTGWQLCFWILNPIPPIVGLFLAAELWAAAERTLLSHGATASERSTIS